MIKATAKVSMSNSTQPRILLVAMILSACLLQPTSAMDGIMNWVKEKSNAVINYFKKEKSLTRINTFQILKDSPDGSPDHTFKCIKCEDLCIAKNYSFSCLGKFNDCTACDGSGEDKVKAGMKMSKFIFFPCETCDGSGQCLTCNTCLNKEKECPEGSLDHTFKCIKCNEPYPAAGNPDCLGEFNDCTICKGSGEDDAGKACRTCDGSGQCLTCETCLNKESSRRSSDSSGQTHSNEYDYKCIDCGNEYNSYAGCPSPLGKFINERLVCKSCVKKRPADAGYDRTPVHAFGRRRLPNRTRVMDSLARMSVKHSDSS